MTRNLTRGRRSHGPTGAPSHRALANGTALGGDLLPLMALLGAVYGWVLAFIGGAVALVVILAR